MFSEKDINQTLNRLNNTSNKRCILLYNALIRCDMCTFRTYMQKSRKIFRKFLIMERTIYSAL